MPQFDSATFAPQLIWLGILFALLYVVVAHFIVPRFMAIQHQRKTALSHLIQKAEAAHAETQHITEMIAKRLHEGDVENRLYAEDRLKELEDKLALQDQAHANHIRHLYKEGEERILRENERLTAHLDDLVLPLTEATLTRLTGEKDKGDLRAPLS